MLGNKVNIPLVDICTLSEHKEDIFMVSRFGSYLEKHQNLHLAHRHSFYHLVFFTKGGGFHTIDFTRFETQPNQIYFMVPGQVHGWNFEGEIDGYVVNFSPSFFQSFLLRSDYLDSFPFFNGIVHDSVINLEYPLSDKIKGLFEDIIHHNSQKAIFQDDIMRALLLQIFILVNQGSSNPKLQNIPSYNYTLLKTFQKLIEKHFTELKLPMEYANLLYVTPNHLNALCKEHLGIQAGEVIRNRIILEAKRQLINQQISITEISYLLNFKDNSYFSKFFKKQVGMTPEEFRKRTH
ncbi:AraC-like DNA-binding protein [Arcicella aurantiaca]|uniref:AraC-like DNA-binding protein n=1 Tax=Arcicella aurantiaca TaxID=591202 RepID=A0A316DQH5_9BACT|nr:helix-turn-helix domain-containing protein [Arcicella aurantiaca]PWK20046.1 AraC-like DNA-binding protein [Arcicella aurantiaca]